ncbi:MAG: hypothetical protein EBS19_06160 [Spirochaetia bacterium]|nr:hypothetical protein [Spirochaetia bacterium]
MSYNNKTFFDFIEEAYSIVENDQAEMASLRRQMQDALRRGDNSKVKSIAQRLGELQVGTKAKIGAALSDKKPSGENTYISGKPQKPEMRDPRLGPTSAQRAAERSADTKLGSSVERGATVVKYIDGKPVRVAANFTKEPINTRSDATRKEIRSQSQPTTENPRVGRHGTQTRTAENAPKSFKERG